MIGADAPAVTAFKMHKKTTTAERFSFTIPPHASLLLDIGPLSVTIASWSDYVLCSLSLVPWTPRLYRPVPLPAGFRGRQLGVCRRAPLLVLQGTVCRGTARRGTAAHLKDTCPLPIRLHALPHSIDQPLRLSPAMQCSAPLRAQARSRLQHV